MAGKRVTLADVARRAGTSTAVVSYVLNDGPRPVSAALRAKVLTALDELDYRPDRIARALRRRRRWGLIGLLVPDVTMPLFGTLAGRIELEARGRGQLVMVGNTGYDPAVEAEFVESFADAGMDGLIVVGGADGPTTARVCGRARVPLVWVHNNRNLTDSRIVRADHAHAGALAARHLVLAHRCRAVAFVGGFTEEEVEFGDRETVAERYRGYESVVGARAARPVPTDLTLAGAYRAVCGYLADNQPPDGLIAGTYGQAAAVLRAVTDAGLRVPRDIALVTFDGDARNAYARPVLTTVRQDIDTIARQALDLLLRPGDTAAALDDVEVHLHTGESCGCREPGLGGSR
ncbi:LacI family DNA-binding transcriptional regulator [Pseudonocardia acaciae]|uniref:LacI family DNA-binding transcriptional regulator n=1 Tax=Pseudonocardia acaciae TaxID=551276 RepID=UPI00048C3796|nr:LacI family DNA-binding transcriptional regulator [Pseudonocardia acaciae]